MYYLKFSVCVSYLLMIEDGLNYKDLFVTFTLVFKKRIDITATLKILLSLHRLSDNENKNIKV